MTQSIPDNPFRYRGRITDPSAFFDRERELELLHLYLTKDRCCQIVGPPGIGKSSLLHYVQTVARQWDGAFSIAYVGLQDPRCHTVSGFLDRAWAAWEDSPAPASLLDMAERIEDWRKRGRRPVLCLDDFEELATRPREFTTDFFLDLRFMAQQDMSIVTASSEPLSELRPLKPFKTPVSPFFNIFGLLRLGPFSEEDAADFVTLTRPGIPPFTPEEKQAILAFAKGYPLALQVACFHVLAAKTNGESLSAALRKAADDARAVLPADSERSPL